MFKVNSKHILIAKTVGAFIYTINCCRN